MKWELMQYSKSWNLGQNLSYFSVLGSNIKKLLSYFKSAIPNVFQKVLFTSAGIVS